MANMFRRFRSWVKDKLPYIIVFFATLIIIIVLIWPRIFIFIRSGEAGILYHVFTSGTETDYVYPEGLHILMPLNRMEIYDTRIQILYDDFEVLTNRGLPIKLNIAVRFAPIYELLGLLHQNVGPDYPSKIILPQIESVLRRNIGRLSPEDIYTNKDGVQSEIIALALQEVGEMYVKVDNIIIRSVELPDSVKNAVEEKLVYEQQLLSYDFRLHLEEKEAERKRLEAVGVAAKNNIVSTSLTDSLLKWEGIRATLDMSKSENAKVVVIGSGKDGLPIILGNQ
ncbi:MAG: prohibitin family protein [Magnetococcus sp. DMHC-1]|nr:prohibitin family protein [Magnetococcales bacterium]